MNDAQMKKFRKQAERKWNAKRQSFHNQPARNAVSDKQIKIMEFETLVAKDDAYDECMLGCDPSEKHIMWDEQYDELDRSIDLLIMASIFAIGAKLQKNAKLTVDSPAPDSHEPRQIFHPFIKEVDNP